MNKRIKTMWEEATGSVWPCHGKLTAGESEDNLKKFAELIVRECGRVGDNWVDREDTGKNLISDKLKEHFGVTV